MKTQHMIALTNLTDRPSNSSTSSNSSNSTTSPFLDTFANDVEKGLSMDSKQLSSMYFYDDIGSHIFQKITQHPDYYLTKTEYDILSSNTEDIAYQYSDAAIDVIELGVGDGHKSELMIQALLKQGKQVTYFPIDISEKAFDLLHKSHSEHENLTIHGIVAEYTKGIDYVSNISNNKKLVLFLGSNIGNFPNLDATQFLTSLGNKLAVGDKALIGFDLKKDVEILNKAYNDESGLTRSFNLNLLDRINKTLGATFNLQNFTHYGIYNPVLGAMESFLLSTKKQDVWIEALNKSFHFDSYEPIHVEYSFKYSHDDIQNLAKTSRYSVVKNYTDANHYFIDSLWEVSR